MAFQVGAFQFPGFQQPTTPPVVPTVGGSGFAQGGGKRHLPKLEELEVFCRLERRRKGQTIVECLREMDEPEVQEVLEEAVAEVAAIKRIDMPRVEFRPQITALKAELAALRGMLLEREERRRVQEEDEDDEEEKG